MSTKIYIGQRAVDTNPFEVADKIRAVVEPMFEAKFAALVEQARSLAGQPWKNAFHLPGKLGEEWDKPIPDNLWDTPEQMYKIIEALAKYPMVTFTGIDIGYNVNLIPDGRDNTLPPLVLLFSEDAGQEYRDALIDAGVVVEFGYWNNTDEPEDMDPDEWHQRKLAWDKLDVPAEDGIQISQPSKTKTVGNYCFKQIDPLVG